MNSGKDKDAQTAYTSLEKSSNTSVAAEALYAKAFIRIKEKLSNLPMRPSLNLPTIMHQKNIGVQKLWY
jgi:hypothetical protein